MGPRNFDKSEMDRRVSIRKMTNDEWRMTNEIRMTNDKNVGGQVFVLRTSSFIQAPRMRDTSGRLRSLLKISSRGTSLI